MAVLVLTLWWLGLRQGRAVAPAPGGSRLQTRVAAATHWLFYLILLLAPLTGLIGWYGESFALIVLHRLLKPALILLIALHVLGALHHQFVLKDNLLERMRRPRD